MKNTKYTKSRLSEKVTFIRNLSIILVGLLTLTGITVSALEPDNVEPIIVEAEPIEHVEQTYRLSDLNLTSGVASILDGDLSEDDIKLIESVGTTIAENKLNNEDTVNYLEGFEEPAYIRCTGYCDYGYTKSGEYVRDGIVAGKLEWLGKTCVIYEVAEDGSCGELIGEYEFLDTGYGINGSLVKGTSIDVWHPSEDAVWDWMKTYGDYVYIQIVDTSTM